MSLKKITLSHKTIKKNLVVIETPFRSKKINEKERLAEEKKNIWYTRLCVHDSIIKGEQPYASHLLYTQPGILNDQIEEERDLGIAAGILWGSLANKIAVYTDLGISEGMKFGIKAAKKRGAAIDYRKLSNWTKLSKQPYKNF